MNGGHLIFIQIRSLLKKCWDTYLHRNPNEYLCSIQRCVPTKDNIMFKTMNVENILGYDYLKILVPNINILI